MLYTVIMGPMSNQSSDAITYGTNTATQRVYLGISGRHNIKIVGWEFACIPAPSASLTGVNVYIPELMTKSNANNCTYSFCHNEHIHPMVFDLGVQQLNNYLTITINTGSGGTLTSVNYMLYLDIEAENKYPLTNMLA